MARRPSDAELHGAPRPAVELAAGLAVALAVLWPFLILHGLPFRHDWFWPVDRAAAAQLVAFGTSEWSPQNLGSRNVYPTQTPLLVLTWACSQAFGTRAALDVVLVGLATIAFAGARRAATQLGLAPLLALVAGALYLAMPAFLDEAIAGHLGDLCGYAALPWLVWSAAAYRTRPTTSALGGGVLAALGAAVQVQYLVLDLIAVAALLLATFSRRALVWALVVVAALTLANAPTLLGLLLTHADTGLLNHERAIAQWELDQSAPLGLALHAAGYTSAYDRAFLDRLGPVTAVVQWMLTWSPLALPALPAARRRGLGIALLALAALGICVVSGLYGPAGGAIRWLFLNVKAMSLFRELFHVAPFVALPLALAIPTALDVLVRLVAMLLRARGLASGAWRPLPSRVAGALAAVLLAAYLAGPASGAAQTWIGVQPQSTAVTAALAEDARDTAPGRIAIFPARMPERIADGTTGVDATAYAPNGAHWSLYEYFPAGAEALASDLLDTGRTAQAERLYARMSVRRVIFRPDVAFARDEVFERTVRPRLAESAAVASGSSHAVVLAARPLVFGGPLPTLAGGDFERLLDATADGRIFAFARQQPTLVAAGLPYLGEALDGFDSRLARRCATLGHIEASRESASPHDAWVSAYRFGLFDPRADYGLDDRAVLTDDVPLARAALAAGRPAGVALLDGGPGPGYRWTTGAPPIPAGHALAVAGIVMSSPGPCLAVHPALASGRLADVTIDARTPTRISGTLAADGAGTLGFTDAYDGGWHLTIDDRPVAEERHFALDGFGNGWVLELPRGTHRYVLEFGNPRRWAAAIALETIVWTLALALAFVPMPARRVRERGTRAW